MTAQKGGTFPFSSVFVLSACSSFFFLFVASSIPRSSYRRPFHGKSGKHRSVPAEGRSNPFRWRVVIPVITNLWTCRGSSFIFKQTRYDEPGVCGSICASNKTIQARKRGGWREGREGDAFECEYCTFYQWIPGYIVSPHE